MFIFIKFYVLKVELNKFLCKCVFIKTPFYFVNILLNNMFIFIKFYVLKVELNNFLCKCIFIKTLFFL
jgi:hypothetical protein